MIGRSRPDTGGLYKIFHDECGVATSFRQMLKARRVGIRSVSVERIAEFLAYGGVSGSRTFVAGILKLSGHEVLLLPADGGAPRIRPKALPAADMRPAEEVVVDHFAELRGSLEGRVLSVDATGGFDTRLVLGLLDREGLPFELAVSGQPGAADTLIAQQLAVIVRRRFHLSGHDLSDLDAAVVETYRFGDGLTDVRRLHRDRQAALDRLRRGVQVMAHGGGGEFFRDHYAIQDFPFYGSSRVKLERFHDLRLMPVALPGEALSPTGTEILRGLRAEMLARCAVLRAPTNIETYDRIFLNLKSPEFYGQYFSNYINHDLEVVAPWLDFRIVHAAMRLSPWARFYHGWHRRMLTYYCPTLAVLPTAEAIGLLSRQATGDDLRDIHVGRALTLGLFLGEMEGFG